MKVYMVTDLEGVAGVVSFDLQTGQDCKYYDAARRLLTAEVNAAVDGLLEAGVEEVIVWDGHGPGGIYFEDLHPAARLLHGRPMAPWKVRNEVTRTCDVCVIVGQHAMAGTAGGTLNHTQSSKVIDHIKLNGKCIGELGQIALYQGAMGQPVFFLTGDEAACREAEELIGGITTVAVKQGLSRTCAVTLSAAEARRRIREGAKLAVRRHKEKPVAPLVWPGPYVLEKRFFHTETADGAAQQPGAERVDSQTVRFTSDNVMDVIYR